MEYHNPVLLKSSVDGLSIKPEGIYVDVTFGGGGHSKMILSKLETGKLFAFDQDISSNKNQIKHPNFKLINANFRYLKNFLRLEGIKKIDGLIADLGVSSYQLDIADRGFSIRLNGELDMRMNINSNLSAHEVVNNYTEKDLADMLYKYGDLRNSRKISAVIVDAREESQINTTEDLVNILNDLSPQKYRNKFLAKIFQAIRIEVNDEISCLEEMLLSSEELLKIGGRLVVLSYHSIEDRLVKNLMKKGTLSGEVKKDFFGNVIKNLQEINKKVIIASESEISNNSRARSAKLRIAKKINEN